MRSVLGLVALGVLFACAPNFQLTRVDPSPRAAKSPDQVEVYLEEPARSYAVIAVWKGEEEAFGDQVKSLRQKAVHQAAALGADAVILSVQKQIGSPQGSWTAAGDVMLFGTLTRVQARLIAWR